MIKTTLRNPNKIPLLMMLRAMLLHSLVRVRASRVMARPSRVLAMPTRLARARLTAWLQAVRAPQATLALHR